MRRRIGIFVGLFAASLSLTAHAALTDSEKAQIAGFVRDAEVADAGRVRALVARPDLSEAEAAAPLVSAYGPVEFDARRAKFTRELLFGAGSDAARSTLAPAVTRALLGRANARIRALPAGDNPGWSSGAVQAAEELVRLHAFVADAIANAGKPPADGHDASAGIRDDALKSAAEAYHAHLDAHATWLKPSAAATGAWVRVRAQVELTTAALARGVIPRHEVSAWLGFDDARRALFERHGVLVEDGGAPAGAELSLLLSWLDGQPLAAKDLDLLLVAKAPSAGLEARGQVARAGVMLGSGAAEDALWPKDVEPAKPDAAAAELAYAVAWQATRAAFAKNPALRSLAQKVAARAARAGADGYLSRDLVDSVLRPVGAELPGAQGASAEQLTAHAVRLLLVDAARATSVALVRSVRGHDEPLAALTVALSVLATRDGKVESLALGQTQANGKVEPLSLSGVTVSGGVVTGFELNKSKIAIELATDGRVVKVTRDGKPPTLSSIPMARLVPETADAFTVRGVRFEKLSGAPRGLSVDDGRLLLAAAEKSGGFDAVAGGKDVKDASIRAKLTLSGAGGGLLVRAQPGSASYDAIALLLSAEPRQALLVLVDGKGRAIELSPAVELAKKGAEHAVSLAVRGQAVTATVDGKKITAKLERAAGTGKVGLAVRAGGRIEARDISSPSLTRGK
ncbi:MAG: hypothetical protein KC776_17480 [Myxococcales bacterium]|nr:hypothetical protein [Myxococcales bacterium]MCB9577984.1 hypothetical protein [Polyangiaceae bacterium]